LQASNTILEYSKSQTESALNARKPLVYGREPHL